MLDGSRITTRKGWAGQRVPELRALFQHYMYGRQPSPWRVKGKILRTDPMAFGGKATLKECGESRVAEPIH